MYKKQQSDVTKSRLIIREIEFADLKKELTEEILKELPYYKKAEAIKINDFVLGFCWAAVMGLVASIFIL
jgi:hypothetical protein